MTLRSLLFTLATTLALCAQAAPGRHIPLDDFVRHDQFTMPRLSPDGSYLAMTVKMPQGDRFISTLTVYALPEMKVVGAVRMPVFEVPIGYAWVSNQRLVVTKGTERGDLIAPMATGEVLAMNFDGSKQEYLYGYDNFKFSSQGAHQDDDHGWATVQNIPQPRNGHVVLNAHLWNTDRSQLYDVNSSKATRKLVADIGVRDLSFVLQSDQKPRFATGQDDDLNLLLYRRNDSTGAWELLKDPLYRGEFEPFEFAPDDSHFVAWSSADGGPTILLRQDMATGARTTLAQDEVGDIERLILDPNGMPVAAGTSIGIPQLRVFDAQNRTAQLYQSLGAQFPGEQLWFVNHTDDGAKLLFKVFSDREPGTYYLYDRASNKAELLFSASPQINPDEMAERRPITFRARDGLTLHGYLTMPANPDKKKLPMVLLPHGGPHGPYDSWQFDEEAQFLASRGYAVLQVNYRGSGGRGPAFRKSGFREWGGKIMDDLADGVRWSIAQGEIDASRVCTYGASFGGYAALMMPIRYPGMFKCAAGYAGVYDLALFFKEGRAVSDRRIRNHYDDYVGRDPAELARNSPARNPEKVIVPVLLVHGSNDKTVPVEHAETMRAALTKAGNAPQWLLADGEGHGFYDTKNVTAFYQQLESFLAKYIGDPQQVTAAAADRAVK